jgi:ferredoxin
MIYTIKALRGLLVAIILISIMHTVPAFNLQSHALRKTNSVSMSITKIPGAGGQIPDDSSMYEPREITVRFINTISGKDVVVKAKEGENLLFLGDKAGVSLPRACRTGLCGSCTCELQDPAAVSSSSNPREGFATIRACSVDCFVPNGMEEMVVDVQRMRKKKEGADSTAALEEETDYVSISESIIHGHDMCISRHTFVHANEAQTFNNSLVFFALFAV